MKATTLYCAGMLALLVLTLCAFHGDAWAAEALDFVEVRDEPQHLHRFENERVRVYDVILPVGYVTLYHRHTENTVYAVVHPTSLKSQAVGGRPVTNRLRQGAVFYNPQRERPLTHQVTNVGDRVGRLIGVELKGDGRAADGPPIAAHGYTEILNNPFVRASKLTLNPGESTGKHALGYPTVTVALSGGIVTRDTPDGHSTTETIEAAQIVYREKGFTQNVQNAGSAPVEFVIYELPAGGLSERAGRPR